MYIQPVKINHPISTLTNSKPTYATFNCAGKDMVSFTSNQYSGQTVEQAMELLANVRGGDDIDRSEFSKKIAQAFDPASQMPKDERRVYLGLTKLYGKTLGLKPDEIKGFSDLQTAFLKNANQVYLNVFQEARKENPEDIKTFNDKMNWWHWGSNVYFDAGEKEESPNKNEGLHSKKSALGERINEIYWDEYSYANSFFAGPGIHAAFLGCTKDDLLTTVTESLANNLVPQGSLSKDYITNELIANVPKANKGQSFFDPKLRKSITDYAKQHYPALFEGYDEYKEIETEKDKHLESIVDQLCRVSINPQEFYDIHVNNIFNELREAVRYAACERDFALPKSQQPVLKEPKPIRQTLFTGEIQDSNKLPFEEYVQYLGYSHPEIFPDRFSILDHLFFTIGTGFEWHDGRLKDHYISDGTVLYKDKRMTNQEFLKLIQTEGIEEKESLKKGYEEQKPRKAYPICEYSRINNVPDNVDKEWLEGAFEALEHVIKNDEKQKEVAQKIYTDLKERFETA